MVHYVKLLDGLLSYPSKKIVSDYPIPHVWTQRGSYGASDPFPWRSTAQEVLHQLLHSGRAWKVSLISNSATRRYQWK